MVHGVDEGVDGVMYVGYHGRMGAVNAILDHTWSDERVSGLWINDRAFGEAGLNGAVCGHFDAPVIMASGDQTLCAEVQEFFGNRDRDRAGEESRQPYVGGMFAACGNCRLIEEAAKRAVINLRRKSAEAFQGLKPDQNDIGIRAIRHG